MPWLLPGTLPDVHSNTTTHFMLAALGTLRALPSSTSEPYHMSLPHSVQRGCSVAGMMHEAWGCKLSYICPRLTTACPLLSTPVFHS